MTPIEQAIKDEMSKALVRLDAKPELLARVDAADNLDVAMLSRAAARLGSDRVLLAIIGSRGDTWTTRRSWWRSATGTVIARFSIGSSRPLIIRVPSTGHHHAVADAIAGAAE